MSMFGDPEIVPQALRGKPLPEGVVHKVEIVSARVVDLGAAVVYSTGAEDDVFAPRQSRRVDAAFQAAGLGVDAAQRPDDFGELTASFQGSGSI